MTSPHVGTVPWLVVGTSPSCADHYDSQGLHECHTGVLSWCMISWFYLPWNMTLGNYSSWSLTWMFWVTRDRAWIINLYSWFYYSILHNFETRVLRIREVCREWFRYAICKMEPWPLPFTILLFSNTFFSVRAGYYKKSRLLAYFRDSKNDIWISVIHDSLLFRFVDSARDPPCMTLLQCTWSQNHNLTILYKRLN